MELSQQLLVLLLLISNINSGHSEEQPKAKVTITPDQHVFRGETVTLRCDIDGEGVSSWQYSWYKDGSVSVFSNQEHTFWYVSMSDTGKYSCIGKKTEETQTSNSDAVTLTVSDRSQTVLSVSPQQWLTEEDSVTLICEVNGSSTGWTFSWYTEKVSSDYKFHHQLLSDSSRGAGGNYTVSSAALNHTGVYVCRAKRGKPAYYTTYSKGELIWVTDYSPPVSLIIRPNRTQHFTSVSFSLSCEDQSNSDRWTVRRYSESRQLKDCLSSVWGSQTGSTCTISSTSTSDTGVYWCQSKSGEKSHPVNITVHQRPKAKVTIKPDQHVFRRETVTLRCDIDGEGDTRWQYNWYKNGTINVFSKIQEHTFWYVSMSDTGKYSCDGRKTEGTQISYISDAVTLTVSDRAQAVLSVSPQKWLTEGDPVTLICEVNSSSTGWTFTWYTLNISSDNNGYPLVSDLSRGIGGNYTVSSAALNHTGVYVCGAERGKPAYYTTLSNTQLIWVTDYSPPVSLIISPKRTQHFTSDSFSLSCEDQSNSDRWTVRRYSESRQLEDCLLSVWGSQTGSTCTISSTSTSDTGVYWCQSKSGEKSHPVNITVHSGVILESPVHPVTEGDTLTLHCLYKHSPNLRADFYKDGSLIQDQTTEMIISTVSTSHEGFYYCKHPERGESPKSWISVRRESTHIMKRPEVKVTVNPYLHEFKGETVTLSDGVTLTVSEKPKTKLTIKPDQHVFRGETVTLRCDIDGEGVSRWQYSWYKDGSVSVISELQLHTFSPVIESDAGKYSCYGVERGGSRRSQHSDEVTLTVSDRAQAVLSVSPQKQWLTEEDSLTLICEVNGSSTGWTFSWYTETVSSDINDYKLLSDSSRGDGGNYTVSSAALKHTGVYVCRAERGKLAYYTTYSNKQPLWVTGVSPPVSLIISPNRTQHFTSVSLSLSCEDQSNSDRWTVRRYKVSWELDDCSSSVWGSQTGSTCTINSTITSDTGVYWCQSESGENSHPVNITVHSGVILESPVHPVTEGDTLTLHCLYKNSTPPNLRADFYKDGSLIQNQTTEMIISTVSKSHEGFYYCKHPERGESPKSWISVRAFDSLKPMIIGVTAGLTLIFLIIVFLVLLWHYKNNKGGWSPSSISQQKNNSQTSEHNQSEGRYKQSDSVNVPTELTYAEFELKSIKKQKKSKGYKGKNTESSDIMYTGL
ncbi:hypothetical protein QQF64_025376 [Cirrhinus molitorella]|uniref:Ig-like domain-containing protein n=1 Tax=Cirrhinus molitorella TaxID=172907 RepID=A0ABR3NNZ5_9TELE